MSFKYPTEIEFGAKVKLSKKEFLDNLSNCDECLKQIKENYPDECTLSLDDSKKVVFLNSADAVKKFSNKEAINNRPKNAILGLITKNYLGSFFRMSDAKHAEVRKTSINGLHKLIVSNAADFNANLTTEINELVKFLGQAGGTLDDAMIYLQQFSANIIVTLGLGARFPYESNKDAEIKKQIRNMNGLLANMNIVDFTNFSLADLSAGKIKAEEKMLEDVYKFLLDNFSAYKTSHPNRGDAKTYGDVVLAKHEEKLKENGGKFDASDNYSIDDILVQYFTLFMAGSQTLGFTLCWAIYYISKNKDLQAKIMNEIKEVNESGVILGKEMDKYKFTKACMQEILRLGSTQAAIPRASVGDVSIDNGAYTLADNTTVVLNTMGMHRDAKYFPEPNEFKPERWLDEASAANLKNSFMPFGAAPRSCIAEAYARSLLFVLIVNLVKNFDLEHVANEKSGSADGKSLGKMGAMRRPLFYNLKIAKK